MSSRYRRGDQHTAYAVDYENIGERNPAYIGDGEDREELMNTRERGGGGTCGAIVSWMTFAFAIVAAVFSIVAMSFSISNNNKIGDVYDGTSSDHARYFRDDIFLHATHGRSYYSKDVPTLDKLEHVSTYVQQVLYPMNTQLKIQKTVYAVVPDADNVPSDSDKSDLYDLKHLNKQLTSGNELCTYTYSAVPSSDEFDYFTIPADATFIAEGSNPPAPCSYDWPSQDATNGESTNYVVLITAMINGATMKPTMWAGVSDPALTPNPAAKYSSNLLYHIVNERIAFVSTDPASEDITAPNFIQKFIPFGRVYGYGNVDLTFTVGTSGTPTTFTYSSYDAVGVPLSLPQSVFVSLCNTANTAATGVASYSGTTLTIKAEAIDGVYPTNPASAKMTFSTTDDTKIPKMKFQALPENTRMLFLDLLTPIATSATTTKTHPFVSAIAQTGESFKLHPFGENYHSVSLSGPIPSHTTSSGTAIHGPTLPKSSLIAKVTGSGDYTMKFNNVTIIPEFSTKTCSLSASVPCSLAKRKIFENFIKLNPEAASIIKQQKRTVVFEIGYRTTLSNSDPLAAATYYQLVYGPATITPATATNEGSIIGTSPVSDANYVLTKVYTTGTSMFSSLTTPNALGVVGAASPPITPLTGDFLAADVTADATVVINMYDLGDVPTTSATYVTIYGKTTYTAQIQNLVTA